MPKSIQAFVPDIAYQAVKSRIEQGEIVRKVVKGVGPQYRYYQNAYLGNVSSYEVD